MMWRECKRCQRRMFYVEGQPLPLEGYCEACYEAVTGKCAMCEGTGQIERAHLGKSDCLKCDGSGRASLLNGESG